MRAQAAWHQSYAGQAHRHRHLGNEVYDAVCCFFLLHELPDDYKRRVGNALLGRMPPGGKLIFVDYHRAYPDYPLKPETSLVFRYLETVAFDM